MILEEFDPTAKAIINPEDLIEALPDFPKVVVACFARETFARMVKAFDGQLIAQTSMSNIAILIYQIEVAGKRLALFNAPVGAAACVAILEDLRAFGMEQLVLFGTCGVLEEDIKETAIVIPTSAIRDEGTSYHYVPASREIAISSISQQTLTGFFEQESISYVTGKVWTTDGVYRETVAKMKARRAEGAICVDMECSAVTAWASFRDVRVYQFFYAADRLSEHEWDARNLSNTADLEDKDKVAQLAISLAVQVSDK